MNKEQLLQNAPIPGENFTSNTKNYPWHRPPDIVDFDEAVEYVGERIMKPKPASGILTMLEMGVPVSMMVQNIVMAGMSRGKWTLNLGLLIAGPIARMIEMMADGAGIEYTMGTEEDETPIVPPANFMQASRESRYKTPTDKEMDSIMSEVSNSPAPEAKPAKTGFQRPKE